MDKYLYLSINIASILIPFIASFYPKHPFYKHWGNYLKANFFVAGLFILWDIYFTKLGVWHFNEQYILGLKLVNIPIEEVLFFFCIPYSSVFVYFALNYLIKSNPFEKKQKYLTLFLIISLAFLGIIYWNRLYTSVTFISTSVFLLFCLLIKNNLAKVYLSFVVTLVFFFIVNGILKGSFIEEPVVLYNNAENSGIRMGTIPIEDIFYGFLLITSIIVLFEYLNTKLPMQK